jgi:glycosyltransferase involved in cell wall biosynthesis
LRSVIVADNLAPPYDEGIKNIAVNFIREVAASLDASLISDRGTGIAQRTTLLPLGKTFLNLSLYRELREASAEVVFYIPSTSLTPFTFLRAAVLRLFSRARIVVVGLQTRKHKGFWRPLLQAIGPHGIVVLSEVMRREMKGLAQQIEVFTPGVDLEQFRPATLSRKEELRDRYGIPRDRFVLLHVGHLKRSRNLQVVTEAIKNLDCSLIVVASSTFESQNDPQVVEALQQAGARIISGAIDAIEEIYQLSDCYVFPVAERTGATEMPLSVLEAMAANLSVVTTPYGALPEVFPERREQGFCYAEDAASFAQALGELQQGKEIASRDLVLAFSWERRVADLMEKVRSFKG